MKNFVPSLNIFEKFNFKSESNDLVSKKTGLMPNDINELELAGFKYDYALNKFICVIKTTNNHKVFLTFFKVEDQRGSFKWEYCNQTLTTNKIWKKLIIKSDFARDIKTALESIESLLLSKGLI